MKGETHVTGGFLVNDKMKLPAVLLYLMLKPSLISALVIYILYKPITANPTSKGAVLADYDQNVIENTPTALSEPWNLVFFKFLKKWGATHRSVHTHNIDLWGILLGIPTFLMLGVFIITKEDLWYICFLYLLGYFVGALSHQFLDMLTITGVNPSYIKAAIKRRKYRSDAEWKEYLAKTCWRVIPLDRNMYRMKPIYFGSIKTPFFRVVKTKFPQGEWGRTGGGWEEYIQRKMNIERYKHTTIYSHMIELVIILLVYNTLVS